MKRIVSLILTVAVVCAMLTIAAAAESDVTYEVGQWVMTGEAKIQLTTCDVYECILQVNADGYYIGFYMVGKDSGEVDLAGYFTANNCNIIETVDPGTVPEKAKEKAEQDIALYNPAGSILSEGSLAIIVGIAAAVIFGLGGYFIGSKKKKTAQSVQG